MKLLLRRSQKQGMLSNTVTFMLDARAELTPDEKENVKKYKMGKTMLYTNIEKRGTGLISMIERAALGIEIRVDDLVQGKHIEVKDIIQMIATEDQIKEACGNFKIVLNTAAQFGGEQIVEV